MRTRTVLLWTAMAFAPVAQAQQVYKCVNGDEVAYQSQPCKDAPSTARTWDHGTYAPPAEADVQRIRQVQTRTRQRDTQRREAVRGGTADSASASQRRCADARRLRDRELERIGLRRTIETLRTWDDYVRNACR